MKKTKTSANYGFAKLRRKVQGLVQSQLREAANRYLQA